MDRPDETPLSTAFRRFQSGDRQGVAAPSRPRTANTAPGSPPSHPTTSGTDAGRDAIAATEAAHDALVAQGAVIAESLSLDAGVAGITISDVREEMERRGIITPAPGDDERALSWLAAVPRRVAGLRRTPFTRKHASASTHGREVRVYVHERFFVAASV